MNHRVLLDTHIAIAILNNTTGKLPSAIRTLLRSDSLASHCSVATLWEIAIKHRLGKIDIGIPPSDIPPMLYDHGIALLAITTTHVLTDIGPEPATRDPFDRLLLSTCAADYLKLVTQDRVLSVHPLAWKPASP